MTGPPPRLLAPPSDAAGHPDADSPYEGARILVRHRGEPLGMLNVDLVKGEADVDTIMSLAATRFGGPGWPQPGDDGLGSLAASLQQSVDQLRSVSVVIGTRNRPEHAVACVAGVLKQDYDAPIEVIVVDNGSSTTATADAIAGHYGQDPRVRYVAERRPGLSRARNIGLAAASHEITSFLSDDIRVDSIWLRAVVRGFGRIDDLRQDSVACVVGYCPPLHLDTADQLYFEQTMAWGWRNGFEPKVIGPVDDDDRLHPYRVGIGNGANISFDTEWFRSIGGFDEALGPGTVARGGEDLDAPVRALLGGRSVAFEPAALGWHADRYDDRTFTTHMYSYGLGLTAFLASHLADPDSRPKLLRRMPFGVAYLARLAILPDSDDRLDGVAGRPAYSLANLAGRAAGPIAFIRSRAAMRREHRSSS